jgi:hypothetical protein
MRQTALVLLICLATGTLAAAEKAFRPGELWPDNNGVHINCHGGGVLIRGETFRRFGVEATVRFSLSIYNTTDEIDRLAEAVKRILRI